MNTTTNTTALNLTDDNVAMAKVWARGFHVQNPTTRKWHRPTDEERAAIVTGLAARLQYGPATPTTVNRELAAVWAAALTAAGTARQERAYRDGWNSPAVLVLVHADGRYVA